MAKKFFDNMPQVDILALRKSLLGEFLVYGFEFTIDQTSEVVAPVVNPLFPDTHGMITGIDMIYPCVVNEDETINYKLNPNNLTQKIDGSPADLSGADGDVMVCYETMYGRKEFDSQTKKQKVLFSRYALEGFEKIPRHFVGVYLADIDGNNKLRSRSGVTPLTNKNIIEFRSYARAKGSSNWNIELLWFYEWKYWLFVLEYMNLNAQSALSTGATNASSEAWNNYNSYYPVWTTDGGSKSDFGGGTIIPETPEPNAINLRNGEIKLEVENFDGINSLNTQMAVFHWQRDVFGHVYDSLDGANAHYSTAEGGRMFICKNPANITSDTFDDYEFYGNLTTADGYVSKFAENTMLGELTGGASNKHCGDYFYVPADLNVGFRGVRAGGRLSSGAVAGFACFHCYYAASARSAHYGSRLFLLSDE